MIYVLALVFSLFCFSEQEPEPEYPQPSRRISSDENLRLEQPVRKTRSGEYYYDPSNRKKSKRPYKGVEQPYRVGKDGTYYYGSDKKRSKLEGYEGVEQPMDTDSEGGYYYSRKKKKKKPKAMYGEKPTRVTLDGAYIYDDQAGETRNSFSLRGGAISAPSFSSPSGATYKDIYGDGFKFLLALEYDWKITNELYFKFASGISSAQGKGRFQNTPGLESQETFQFFLFPNTFNLSYKFQIWDIQYLTPYIEGGPGYFTFIESRNDGSIFDFDSNITKIGGALVASAAGGLLISITKIAGGVNSFRSDYGATQAWVDLQFKQIFGLDKRKDFTSNMITAGISVGF